MRKRPAKGRLPDASNRLEGDNTLAVGRDGDVAVFVNARDFRVAHAGRCRVEHTSRCDPIRIVEQEASVCVGLLQGQFLELLLAVELQGRFGERAIQHLRQAVQEIKLIDHGTLREQPAARKMALHGTKNSRGAVRLVLWISMTRRTVESWTH